jgi:hypothetical protein
MSRSQIRDFVTGDEPLDSSADQPPPPYYEFVPGQPLIDLGEEGAEDSTPPLVKLVNTTTVEYADMRLMGFSGMT